MRLCKPVELVRCGAAP